MPNSIPENGSTLHLVGVCLNRIGMDYSYATAGRNWFVLSGVKAGTIGYLRCKLGPLDIVGCFDIEYPASQAKRWAPVVERLGRSLRLSTTADP